MKQMSYSELVKYVENSCIRMTRFDVVCWLIGYQGVVTADDYNNILRLYSDNFVD